MPLSLRNLALIAAAAVVMMPASQAVAAGGARSPSASVPQYDAAEEYREGVTAYNAGDYDAAATHFQRVTKATSNNAEAHYMLGASYMKQGKAAKARRPFENAVKYAPDMIKAHRDLALAYASLKRGDDAQEILDTLSARSDTCGGSCADQSELDEAIAAIQDAIGGEAQAYAGPDMRQFADAGVADALYYQAVGLINEGQFEAALRTLDKAALAFGAHPDILTYQGFANRKLARFDVAEGYYTRALAIAPEHYGALEYYGELKVERGDLAGARANLAKLDKLCSFGCFEAEELRNWIDRAS